MPSKDIEILKTLQEMDCQGTLQGCYADIPIEVYHSPECPGVSSTTIKTILKKSYRHHEAERQTVKKSPSLHFGSAFHCFVNEPDLFAQSYKIIQPRSSEFIPPGMSELRMADFQVIQKMSKKLFEHPTAKELLSNAGSELTFFSRDQETGILKKCRPDAILGDKISDLKTCESACLSDFTYDARKYQYRLSAAFYLEVCSEVTKKYLRDFYLICCEKSEPYEIAVYRVDDASIARGEEEIRTALRTIQKIKEEGSKAWTGLPTEIKEITI